jgi:hypothetical protein
VDRKDKDVDVDVEQLEVEVAMRACAGVSAAAFPHWTELEGTEFESTVR